MARTRTLHYKSRVQSPLTQLALTFKVRTRDVNGLWTLDCGPWTLLSFWMRFIVNLNQLLHRNVRVDLRARQTRVP